MLDFKNTLGLLKRFTRQAKRLAIHLKRMHFVRCVCRVKAPERCRECFDRGGEESVVLPCRQQTRKCLDPCSTYLVVRRVGLCGVAIIDRSVMLQNTTDVVFKRSMILCFQWHAMSKTRM